jgi:hypothetical protein
MATITVTPTQTFVSGNTVTPATLNQLAQSTVALTAGTIVDADVSASAAIALSKLATGAATATVGSATCHATARIHAGAVMPFAKHDGARRLAGANGAVQALDVHSDAVVATRRTQEHQLTAANVNVPDLRGIFVRGSG